MLTQNCTVGAEQFKRGMASKRHKSPQQLGDLFVPFCGYSLLGSGDDVDCRDLVLLDATIGCIDRRWLDLFSLLGGLPPLRMFAVVVPRIDYSRQVHRSNVHTGLLLSYR